MRRSGTGDYYERLEQREVVKLADDVVPHWQAACRRRHIRPLPFKDPTGRRTYKSFRNQRAASRSQALCCLNTVIKAARSKDLYEDGLSGVLDPDVFEGLLDGPLAAQSGASKWKICRNLWRIAWEFYESDLRWMLVLGKRYRSEHVYKKRTIDPDLPQKLLKVAEQRSASVDLEKAMTLATAIFMRTTAHIALSADLAARRSETSLMGADQTITLPEGQAVFIDPCHSKTGTGSLDPVSAITERVLGSYVSYARPFLVKRRTGDPQPVDALWITSDGLPAEAPTMSSAFRRATRAFSSNGLASGDLRRSVASTPGLTQSQRSRRLKQVPGPTASLRYSKRDRGAAVALNAELSTVKDGDILTFSQPMPPRRKRAWK